MKAKHLITATLVFTIFISCNRASDKSFQLAELKEPSLQAPNEKEKKQVPIGTLNQQFSDSMVSPSQPVAIANPDWDKKIIKTATVRLEIKDFKKYNDYVHNAVRQYGGYIAQEEQNLSDDKSETVISIKVPVAQFEMIMNQLPGTDSKVLERKITTEDVTGQVIDTKSRLEAKKQMRIKYLEFLKQSKNMEEVLQVQNEINSIQEEIESAAGRVEYLSHQSSYSTINLTFYQPFEGFKPTDSAPSFLTRITNAFKTGANWIAELFVGLVAVWPLLLFILVVYFGWRRVKVSKVAVNNSGNVST